MLVIALTGGIGSGKSTISERFKSKNIPIIDTDIIARQIVEPGKPAYLETIKIFGDKILDEDQNINRQTLRERVFSSPKKRLQLEEILHPIIWNEVVGRLSELSSSSSNRPPYCIVVVPLLLENSSQSKAVKFDRILVADVTEEIQIKRATSRDNCDKSIIENIMKNQVSRQTRIDAADDIILNTDNIDSLNTKIEKLHQQYCEQSQQFSKKQSQ